MRGWHAGDDYPLPGGTSFCLIHRFANSPWLEAGAFWENTIGPGWGGTLQLNTNDNNPYNGDPYHKWQVFVDVSRAGAAAARIYV